MDVVKVSLVAATIAYHHETEVGLKASFKSSLEVSLQLGPL